MPLVDLALLTARVQSGGSRSSVACALEVRSRLAHA
jgi:hypothetical protein